MKIYTRNLLVKILILTITFSNSLENSKSKSKIKSQLSSQWPPKSERIPNYNPSLPIPNLGKYIQINSQGKCMKFSGPSNLEVTYDNCSFQPEFLFKFKPKNDGTYSIFNKKYPNYVLDDDSDCSKFEEHRLDGKIHFINTKFKILNEGKDQKFILQHHSAVPSTYVVKGAYLAGRCLLHNFPNPGLWGGMTFDANTFLMRPCGAHGHCAFTFPLAPPQFQDAVTPPSDGNESNIGGFCMKNCVPNLEGKEKKCRDNGIKKCHSCKINPALPQLQNNLDAKKLCRVACNALENQITCDYYGYTNDKKKKIDQSVLNKFSLKALRKYLLRK